MELALPTFLFQVNTGVLFSSMTVHILVDK